MHSSYLLPLLLSPAALAAAGLYPKGSAVLNLDQRSYEKFVAKSNYTSIVEFYAPWCGHCQNLKPAYEKVASSLSGIARVAAVNCDDESNKPFCGSMGIQGFPTLKIVKPSKKPGGRGVVEDYQGPRTAKGINDALVDKIANHVARLKDDTLAAWLEKDSAKPKALFFSDKGVVSPLVKALAIDFLAVIDIAQVKSSEKKTVDKYGITSFPAIVLLQGADKEPIMHTGDMKKPSLIQFLSQAAAPNPDTAPEQDKPKAKSTPKKDKDKSKAKKPTSSQKEFTPPTPKVVSVEIEEPRQPTESPSPNVVADNPPPVHLPVEPAPKLTLLNDEAALQKACLHTKSSTCILAFTPPGAATAAEPEAEHPSLLSLREIAHKHKQRGAKIFPFYAVPDTNGAGQSLVTALGTTGAAAADGIEIIAVNAKKGWWSRFGSEVVSRQALEDWIDSIRFGEMSKEALPEGLVKEVQEQVKVDEMGEASEDEKAKKQRIREQIMREADKVLYTSDEGGVRMEMVELDDDFEMAQVDDERAAGHDEL